MSGSLSRVEAIVPRRERITKSGWHLERPWGIMTRLSSRKTSLAPPRRISHPCHATAFSRSPAGCSAAIRAVGGPDDRCSGCRGSASAGRRCLGSLARHVPSACRRLAARPRRAALALVAASGFWLGASRTARGRRAGVVSQRLRSAWRSRSSRACLLLSFASAISAGATRSCWSKRCPIPTASRTSGRRRSTCSFTRAAGSSGTRSSAGRIRSPSIASSAFWQASSSSGCLLGLAAAPGPQPHRTLSFRGAGGDAGHDAALLRLHRELPDHDARRAASTPIWPCSGTCADSWRWSGRRPCLALTHAFHPSTIILTPSLLYLAFGSCRRPCKERPRFARRLEY